MFLINLEGNIGAGKSTLLKRLEEYLLKIGVNFLIVSEPTEIWQTCKNVNGLNILESLYANYQENAFVFQLFAQVTRISELKKAMKKKNDFLISERSFLSGLKVFGEMYVDNSFLSKTQQNFLESFAKESIEELPKMINIYLNVPVKKCLERIKERARSGEEKITLEYLSDLEKKYQKMNFDIIITDKDVVNIENLWTLIVSKIN